MDTTTFSSILIFGDCHGEWQYLKNQITKNNITDSLIIGVGDNGEGFHHKMEEVRIWSDLDSFFKKRNLKFVAIRGNHSNPSWFSGGFESDFFGTKLSNIEFVPDYTYKKINGKTFLFVGGAISIDRKFRVQGRDYWKDEIFVLPEDYKTLPKCDVLITHSSGHHQFPQGGLAKIAGFFIKDVHLESELLQERKLIHDLYYQVLPKIGHFYGHFHEAKTEYVNNTVWRCLDINEVADITHLVNYEDRRIYTGELGDTPKIIV